LTRTLGRDIEPRLADSCYLIIQPFDNDTGKASDQAVLTTYRRAGRVIFLGP
jgi:hypothetical protein